MKKETNALTTKTEYILRLLSKTKSKKWEHYVINRIYHRLADPDVEFICQQCIKEAGGRIYLVDLYFPSLGLYLEIDEGHHFNDEAQIRDAKRRFDIADATGLSEYRIPVVNVTLDEVNVMVDEFIAVLKDKKASLVAADTFTPWTDGERYTAKQHVEKGYIEISPNAAFRTHKDALNCFGYRGGKQQAVSWRIPKDVCDAIGLPYNSCVWFPKINDNPDWENSLSDDGLLITEKKKEPDDTRKNDWEYRIVMAKSKDEYNINLYRFIGVFKVVPEYSYGNEHRFIRVSTTVKTYIP